MAILTKSGARFQRSLVQVIGFPTIVLIVLAGILVVQILNLLSLANWVDHTDRVIAQVTLTQKLMLDQQTGRRGYLIGGEPKFLDQSRSADVQIGPAFDNLAHLVSENPQQSQRIVSLREGYDRWNRTSQANIALYDRDASQARAFFNRGTGKARMDVLRDQFRIFQATEESLRASRQQEAQSASRRTLIGLGVLAIVTGILLGVVLVRQLRRVAADYEGALKSSYQDASLLSATLQSIGEGVLVTDAAGRITDMNPVAEGLTGWTLAQARGRPTEKVFALQEEHAGNAILRRRSGEAVPIENSVSPIRDETGVMAGTVLVFRDISERQKIEQERAAAYEREHAIAESLQRSLLSRPPSESLGGLTVETFYRPARAEAQVGGDFYDIFVLEEGKVALVVGDISGKGLQAASRTAEAKYTLRAYLREYSHAAVALSRLNLFLCESQMLSNEQPEYFLCLTLAIISPRTGQIEIAAAGMEPPLLLPAVGEPIEIPVSGLPMGITPKAEYEALRLTLDRGTRLLIATDGITEAGKGEKLLGNIGLSRLAAQMPASATIQEIGGAVLDGARSYSGGHFRDDVCLLLAERA